jgi:signal transduction histidine kinase
MQQLGATAHRREERVRSTVHRRRSDEKGRALWDDLRYWSRNWPPEYDGPAVRHRIERLIANTRVVIAAFVLAASWLDPEEPARLHDVVYALGASYLVYSLAVLGVVRRRLPRRGYINLIHIVDLLFPIALITFTAGPRSPYFILLVFSILFGAIRWGMSGALFAGGIGMVAWLAMGVALLDGGSPLLGWAPLNDPDLYLLRASYVVIVPVLLGYLAEGRRRVSAEQAVLGSLLTLAHGSQDIAERLEKIFAEGFRLYPARRILLAVQDSPGGRAWLWSFEPPPRGQAGGRAEALFTSIQHTDWPLYFGPRPGPVWQAELDPGDPLALVHPCEVMVGCDVTLGGEIYGRMLLLDPVGYPLPRRRLRLLEKLGTQLAPPLLSEYLLGQLRDLGARDERRRLALELHDGVLQSLCGLEMEVAAWRRGARDAVEDAERLESVQTRLNETSLELRRLMDELSYGYRDPALLSATVRQLAARVRRETGLEVEIIGIDALRVGTRRMAREIAAMVQEALVNVRKHAHAHRVVVEHRESNGEGRLAIRDDGRGFPFTGRLCGNDLEIWEHAPTVLLSRARSIGARLVLESHPGEGASVEIAWSLNGVPGMSVPVRAPQPG